MGSRFPVLLEDDMNFVSGMDRSAASKDHYSDIDARTASTVFINNTRSHVDW